MTGLVISATYISIDDVLDNPPVEDICVTLMDGRSQSLGTTTIPSQCGSMGAAETKVLLQAAVDQDSPLTIVVHVKNEKVGRINLPSRAGFRPPDVLSHNVVSLSATAGLLIIASIVPPNGLEDASLLMGQATSIILGESMTFALPLALKLVRAELSLALEDAVETETRCQDAIAKKEVEIDILHRMLVEKTLALDKLQASREKNQATSAEAPTPSRVAESPFEPGTDLSVTVSAKTIAQNGNGNHRDASSRPLKQGNNPIDEPDRQSEDSHHEKEVEIRVLKDRIKSMEARNRIAKIESHAATAEAAAVTAAASQPGIRRTSPRPVNGYQDPYARQTSTPRRTTGRSSASRRREDPSRNKTPTFIDTKADTSRSEQSRRERLERMERKMEELKKNREEQLMRIHSAGYRTQSSVNGSLIGGSETLSRYNSLSQPTMPIMKPLHPDAAWDDSRSPSTAHADMPPMRRVSPLRPPPTVRGLHASPEPTPLKRTPRPTGTGYRGSTPVRLGTLNPLHSPMRVKGIYNPKPAFVS